MLKRIGKGGLVCAMAALAGCAPETVRDQAAGRNALVLKFERKSWQVLTAACAAPAFYAGGVAVAPLIYDDGTGTQEIALPHDTLTVKDLGSDARSATAALAARYWKQADTAFSVSTYEQALWVAASASLLNAPVLVEPEKATLQALGVKRVIAVGMFKPDAAEVVALASKEAVWQFQIATAAAKKKTCDYIIVTNPYDADDILNPNVQWPYLSLATAPLAAYRHALVQTGDYTSERAQLHALGVSLGDAGDKAKLAQVKPSFVQVKADSYAAAMFLKANAHEPKFLALVGGSVEVPHYIIDLHTTYKYWNISIDYVPADTPYASLIAGSGFGRFVKPDLGVGRIMADNVQDASMQLVKTFFKKEYKTGGKYAALAPAGWEKKSVVYDGHRLNQPDEGGPDASPDEPFHPAIEVRDIMAKAKMSGEYVFPRDQIKKGSEGIDAPELFAMTSGYGLVQYLAHGDPPYMRIEAGRSGRDMKNYLATGEEFRKRLAFAAPTVAYVIGCNVGCVNAPFESNDEFLPTSAIHAGAVAFLAPNKCQAICFWRYAPKGPGADQCFLFWDNFLNKKMPIGVALNEAKWQGYVNWKDKQFENNRDKDSDNAIEVDAPSLVLFGDPALMW